MSSSTTSTNSHLRDNSSCRPRRSASWSSSARSFLKGQGHREQASSGESSAPSYNDTPDSSDRGFRLLPKRLRQKSSANDDAYKDETGEDTSGGHRGMKWKRGRSSAQTKDLLFNNIFHRLNTSRSQRSERAQRRPKPDIPIIRVTSPGASIPPRMASSEFTDRRRNPKDFRGYYWEPTFESKTSTSQERDTNPVISMVDRKTQDQDIEPQLSQPTILRWGQESNQRVMTDSGNKPEHNGGVRGDTGGGTDYTSLHLAQPLQSQPPLSGNSDLNPNHRPRSPPSEMTPRQAMEFQLAMDRWQGREIGTHGGIPQGVLAPGKLMGGSRNSWLAHTAEKPWQRCPSSTLDPNKRCSLLYAEEEPTMKRDYSKSSEGDEYFDINENSPSIHTNEACSSGQSEKEITDDGGVVNSPPLLFVPDTKNGNAVTNTPSIGFLEFLRAVLSFTRVFIVDRKMARFAILSTRYLIQLVANTLSFCLLLCNFALVFSRGASLRDALEFIAATDKNHDTGDRTRGRETIATTLGTRILRVVVLIVLVGVLALVVRVVRNAFALLELTLRILVAAKDALEDWMDSSNSRGVS